MDVITTKYLGPTNYRGARIKATCSRERVSITLSYDPALSPSGNHDVACEALVRKLRWWGFWVAGDLPKGYAYVCAALYETHTGRSRVLALRAAGLQGLDIVPEEK